LKTCLDILCPFPAETLADRLAPWECQLRRFEDPLELLPVPEAPTVLLCDRRLLARPEVARGVLARFNPLHLKVVYLGRFEDWHEAGLMDFVVNAVLRPDAHPGEIFVAVRSALNSLERGRTLALLEGKLYQFNDDFERINAIGKALTAERDLNKLLRLMLEQSMSLTEADAGSIFLVEDNPEGGKQLRFKITQNNSITTSYDEFVMALTTGSIAGYVASTGRPLLLADVYQLSPDLEYSFNRQFDRDNGYRTGSMLVVPMVDHKDRILGVIQLLNRKNRADGVISGEEDFQRLVIPFLENHKDFIMAIAGEAAVAIENSHLYDSIETAARGPGGSQRHRHRIPGPHHQRSQFPGGRHDGAPGRGRRPGVRGPLPGPALRTGAPARDPLRQPAARLRQGGRARGGAGQGAQALRPPVHLDPGAFPLAAP
jgi:hypothetical protein